MAVVMQITSGQGPQECRQFASFVRQTILQEAEYAEFRVLEDKVNRMPDGLKSARITLSATPEQARMQNWEGTWQWICKSPLRPHHGRRNWFVAVSCCEQAEEAPSAPKDIRYIVCRSGGRGGQNVNRRNTAVRAVDEGTGLAVRIESERSYWRNRETAMTLLAEKVKERSRLTERRHDGERHAALYRLERGNAVRIYRGETFEAD